MKRFDIIETIGKDCHTENVENGEFSYPKALQKVGKKIDDKLVLSSKGKKHKYLDIRFTKGNISILVETKTNFNKWNDEKTLNQLQAYVNYEKVLTGNKIIAILANTEDDRIKVWWGSDLTIDESHQIKNQYSLKDFDEYAEMYTNVQNDKEKVLKNTYELNETLHRHGIGEKIRSQFVGTCLLALKNDLVYKNLTAKQILGGIEETITALLDKNLNKKEKLDILKKEVLSSQDIRVLKKENLEEILTDIKDDILPYINEKSTAGQDILNLFFTTFNKYVGKADKNQAFTPDHIVHFMCKVVGINRNSKVLDPCCGSGAFLVRAMTDAMDDCANKDDIEKVKKENIFGIEFEDTAFGLATTNMLIHGDGNSNVKQGSCFDMSSDIQKNNIDIVLMNPPYNAQRKHSNPKYVEKWAKKAKEDPSKGLHYVHYIASIVKTGKLAVLLPMKCAIASKGEIKKFKEKMLEEHTLDAVFTLPPDVFHPGASVDACCMIFHLGQRHENAPHDTFFGYFRDDGFDKKKNLGRVEKTKPNSNEGIWADIEAKWLSLYRSRKSVAGLSVTKKIEATHEWLAEPYMETNYLRLTDDYFEKAIRHFVAFKVANDEYENRMLTGKAPKNPAKLNFKTEDWINFPIHKLFYVDLSEGDLMIKNLEPGNIPLISSGESNNGVVGYIDEEGDGIAKIFSGNKITVDMFCNAFYQERDFYAVSHGRVNMLTPKFNMTPYSALFLCCAINYENYRFSYGRGVYSNVIEKLEIKLPAITEEEPDWKFMESYIKSLSYSENL